MLVQMFRKEKKRNVAALARTTCERAGKQRNKETLNKRRQMLREDAVAPQHRNFQPGHCSQSEAVWSAPFLNNRRGG